MTAAESSEIKLTATSYRVRLKRWQALAALINGPRVALRLPRDQVSPEIRVGHGISGISVTAHGGGGGGSWSSRDESDDPGTGSQPGTFTADGPPGRWCCQTAPGTGHTATCPTLGTQAGGMHYE
jgi:hypothetical protein